VRIVNAFIIILILAASGFYSAYEIALRLPPVAEKEMTKDHCKNQIEIIFPIVSRHDPLWCVNIDADME
jgi:hypothetical protein